MPERYQHALKTDADPSEDKEIAALRAILKSARKGKLRINSSPNGEILELPFLPHTLPQASASSVRAKIAFHGNTFLFVYLQDPLVCPNSNLVIRKAGQKQKFLLRPNLIERQNAVSFALAMHEGQVLSLDLTITYRWSGGPPNQIWIEGFSKAE